MAFRLRRGTDAERLIITPEEGELIYTTDSKKIFVGDGTTLGGNAVDTTSLINLESELGNLSIDSFGDVNSDSTVPSDGDVLAYDAGTGDWRAQAQSGGGGATAISDLTDVDTTGLLNDDVLVFNSVSGNFERATFRLEALLDVTFSNLNNSVLVYDNVAGTFNQTDSLNNNIVDSDSNVILDVTSSLLTGDVQGNILAEDSSIVVNIGADAGNSTVTASLVGDVEGDLTGDVLATNGVSVLDNGTDGTDAFFTGDVEGNVTGSLNGTVTGTVNGTLNGTVNGILNGDVIGSVFNDASSIIIDGQFGDVYPRKIISDGLLRMESPLAATTHFVTMESNDQFTSLALLRNSESDISGSNSRYGQIRFGRDDSGGRVDTNIISGNRDFIWIANSPSGTITDDKLFTVSDGSVGIGTATPSATLDVRGPIMPGTYADTTARDTAIPTPVAGMMIYLIGTSKFQGNTDGTITGWVDLN
jgi:hypothetical protein